MVDWNELLDILQSLLPVALKTVLRGTQQALVASISLPLLRSEASIAGTEGLDTRRGGIFCKLWTQAYIHWAFGRKLLVGLVQRPALANVFFSC